MAEGTLHLCNRCDRPLHAADFEAEQLSIVSLLACQWCGAKDEYMNVYRATSENLDRLDQARRDPTVQILNRILDVLERIETAIRRQA